MLPPQRPPLSQHLQQHPRTVPYIWAGGQGGATADTWQFVCWPRGRGTPSDSRTQRYGWAAGRSSASRVPLSSNATTTGHGLCKLEMVVIVDSRMLVLYFYFLINHIQFNSRTVPYNTTRNIEHSALGAFCLLSRKE
jgi:hypothetical protein